MRLCAEKLCAERSGETVFSNVDFTLSAGEALVITGANGSGKSTLLRVIAGLLPIAKGKLILDAGAIVPPPLTPPLKGEGSSEMSTPPSPLRGGVRGGDNLGEDVADLASALHYLGHLNGMKSALTVDENLRFWQDFCGSARLPANEALEKVGLGGIGHLPFGYLSTGQKRRAAIARLLVSHRPIWLLDEPTAGLDKASEARFAGLMQAHCASGGIILAATHLPLGLEGMKSLEMERPPSPLRGGSSGETDRGGGVWQ